MQKNVRNIVGLIGSIGLLMSASSALAGSKTWDFSTDPQNDPTFEMFGNNDAPWVDSTGNPGGFLKLTYSENSQNKWVIFPDIDNGKIVTAFEFAADLRVGNPQSDRAADGFSISFARASDRLLVDATSMADINMFAVAGGPENGTQTGIAIGFDTWSGNTLPDGPDIEGIIIRVDNVTVLKYPMPTRNGGADDATSMQTGPRDAAYWSGGGAARDPLAWAGIQWRPFSVKLDTAGKLTVKWKGVTILDAFQTAYFPSPGRIVLACRTGGSNENTDFDNIKLITTAQEVDNQAPTTPADFKAAEVGAGRVMLNWSPSTDNSGRVAYQIEKDGILLTTTITSTNYVDSGLTPKSAHTYKVRATDVSGNVSAYTSALPVTTVDEVASVGVLKAEIFGNITGTAVQGLLDDPNFQANTPSRVVYVFGMEAGTENGNAGWNDSFGDNYGMRITGTLTPSETAKYDFFIRSDDASQFYLNTTAATLPVPGTDAAIIEELGCCSAFLEPNDAGKPTVTTAEPIALTAGKSYGFVILLKEGGGGDGVAVGWRKEGNTAAASSLPFISGAVLAGKQDAVGASVNITQAPKDMTVFANEKVSFSVKATTSSPYSTASSYQWYKNGAILPGANAATYSIPVVAMSDAGAKFKVMVIAVGAQVTSTEATLTVNADNKLPTITAVNGDETFTKVTIGFSEPVKAPSATTTANYALDNGGTVTAATLVDQYTVTLTTSKLTENTLYTLTVNNVQDNAANAIAANTKFKFQTWSLVSGRAKMEQWNGIAGTAVQGLYDDPKWTDKAAPDVIRYLGGLTTGDNTGENFGDNYGATVKAYLIPTETALYNFFIRSDDASQFYLSQTETFPVPGTDTVLIEELGCCSAFLEANDATKPTVTTATPVSLTAGKKYAVLAVFKEGGGGDFVQVAWRKSTDTKAAGSLTPITANAYWYGGPATTNVLSTNDVIVASSANSPTSGNENAKNVLDSNSATKYLNFDKLNTGFTVTPKSGASVITAISLTTANDSPNRDPLTYKVEGSLDGTTFATITEGTMPAVTNRFYLRTYTFANAMPYSIYKVTFPTVADAATANSMQIADVALLGNGFGGTLAGPVEQPKITGIVKNADGTITVTWTGGGTLEAATSVSGPYAPIAGSTSPYTFTPTASAMFGRIMK